MLRLVSVRKGDVGEVHVKGGADVENRVGSLEHIRERLDIRETAVRDGVEMGEVEHGTHPAELGRDREYILGRSQLADAAHHLNAERDSPALLLEPLP